MPSRAYSSCRVSARSDSLYFSREVPVISLVPSAAAASATSTGKRSGQWVASNRKARSGRRRTVTARSSQIRAAPARSSARQTDVSACFDRHERFSTRISPASAPPTSQAAAALQSPSIAKSAGR